LQQKNLSMRDERVHAVWRVYACSAGLCTGVQVFLVGAGAAIPLCMNAVWIAALCSPAAAALTAVFCHRAVKRGKTGGRVFRAALCAAFVFNAAFAVSSLLALSEQTLLPQAQASFGAAAAVAAAFFCALSGRGLVRLGFALRYAAAALPAVLFAVMTPHGKTTGLFPLLGAGVPGLLYGGGCMAAAAFPVLLLLDVPQELAQSDGDMRLPEAGFFVRRAAVGAAVGVLLLFVRALGRAYGASAPDVWGERLLFLSVGPREGLGQTALTLFETLCILLLAGNMLLGARQSALSALRSRISGRTALALCTAALIAVMAALIYRGPDAALFAVPCLLVPLAMLPFAAGLRGGKR